MRLIGGAVIFFVLLAPLPVMAQGMGWDGRPVQPLPPAQGSPYGYAPGYNINPQTMFIYEEEKKSPGAALVLSLIFPGLGNIYADHWMGAVVTWVLIIGGVSIAMWGIEHTDLEPGGSDNGGAIVLGFLVALGGGVYSVVDAYQSAKEYNRELARRLGLPIVSLAPIRMSGSGETAWGPALMLRF
jgi:TM2 domain-containing membrane protein YozV